MTVQNQPPEVFRVDRIRKTIPGAQVVETALRAENTVYKLLPRTGGVQTKIEVTPVLRGSVYDPELRAVSRAVEGAFGFAEARVVSFADRYAGKMVAALDRQGSHAPRRAKSFTICR